MQARLKIGIVVDYLHVLARFLDKVALEAQRMRRVWHYLYEFLETEQGPQVDWVVTAVVLGLNSSLHGSAH